MKQDFSDLCPGFQRDGYVIVRSLLPAAEFEQVQRELDRYIRDVVPHSPAGDAFYEDGPQGGKALKQLHRLDQDPFFAAYKNDPTWRQLAETLIGEPCVAESPEWFNKPPGSTQGTPPHQDNYYFCLEPCNVVTVWMALDTVDDENACLRYVPGSHLRPVRPHGHSAILGFSQGILDYGSEDAAQEVAIHLQPGDAVVHHGNLIHLAGPNRSTARQRRALAMVFKGTSCRRDETAYQRYLAALEAQHESLLT